MSGASSQGYGPQQYNSLQPLNMFRAFQQGASQQQLNAMNPVMPRPQQFLPPPLQTKPMSSYMNPVGQDAGQMGQSGQTAFGGLTGFAPGADQVSGASSGAK